MNVVVLCILIQVIAISMVLKRQQDGQKLFKGTCAGHGELSCCHSRDTRHSCQKCPEERSCNEHSRYHTLGGIGLALTTIGTSQHKPKHSLQEEFEKFIIKSVESNQSLIFFIKKINPVNLIYIPICGAGSLSTKLLITWNIRQYLEWMEIKKSNCRQHTACFMCSDMAFKMLNYHIRYSKAEDDSYKEDSS
jgi:hypothetical protein